MHRTLPGLLAVLWVAHGALASGGASTPAGEAEQQLRRLERDRTAAEISRDAATLRRVLDDQFIATFGAGEPVDKEGFISQIIGDPADTMQSQEFSDETLRINRDTAVIVHTDTVRGTDGGTPYARTFRITTTYIRRQGQWHALAEHLAALRPPPNPVADEIALRRIDNEWVAAAESRGLDAWMAFYADSVLLLPPNEPAVSGKDRVRKSIGALLALPGVAVSWHPTRVEVARSGDLAYLAGAYTLAFNDPKGNPVSDSGKLLEVWRRQPDGTWKCVVDTWNSDLAAPGR